MSAGKNSSATPENRSSAAKWLLGEFLGTFLLIFFGLGAGMAVLLAGVNLSVPLAWGGAVVVAVCVVGRLSGAHLNPAVTIGLATARKFPAHRIAGYALAQCLGAFAASAVLYGIFRGRIAEYEAAHAIVRGAPGSEATAMLFGEFFPSPGGRPLPANASDLVSLGRAFFTEVLGTAVLMLVVLTCGELAQRGRSKVLTVPAVGLTVALLIALIGPITMACFNPARDIAPRLFSYVAGWGDVVFTTNGLGWLVVYIVAPISGAVLGALLHRSVLARLFRAAS